jgi:hypothetical protein
MYNIRGACEGAEPVPISAGVVQKATGRMRHDAPDYGLIEWRKIVHIMDRKETNYRRRGERRNWALVPKRATVLRRRRSPSAG